MDEHRNIREIEFKLRNGGRVFVEAEEADRGALVASGGLRDVAGTFEDAIAGLGPVADAVLGQLTSLAQKPEEISVEFGATIKVEAGVLIAKTAADGNFKITLKWKHPEKAHK